jgi:hypothetical protein
VEHGEVQAINEEIEAVLHAGIEDLGNQADRHTGNALLDEGT